MALDADEVVVAGDADVFVAPVGTAGPTTPIAALNVAFVNLGYTSEDGITWTPGMEVNEVRAHQSFYAIRHVVTGRSLEIGMNLLQWNAESFKLAMGGGSFATTAGPPAHYTYTPPAPSEIYYRSLVIDWADGTKHYRLHVPKVMATSVDEITLARAEESGLGLTLAAVATDGAAEFTFLTDDPAFAA
jgi:hypothetical protein